ncbi:hypothetical protein VTN02DRAFT_3287 [Thermoascus thermophilus]
MTEEKKKTVAVVGSGLAGLVAAYLLHNDPQQRYQVRLLEQKNQLSLSSESISIPVPHEEKAIWADVPMRAFAGGFYRNLIRLCDYLDVRYRPQPFLFSFARLPRRPAAPGVTIWPHMIHASNFHQIPPVPLKLGLVSWLFEAAYVLFWYLWFTVCCHFVPPHEGSSSSPCESLERYLERIYLPWRFTADYLLPLISSVCTCSHQDLLNFPASDVVEYKRRTLWQHHYVVDDGVQTVQEKLARGVDVRLGVHLTHVAPGSNGVRLRWLDSRSGVENVEVFDIAVLAVSPDIVASTFDPLKAILGQVPMTTVESVAHTDRSTVAPLYGTVVKDTVAPRHAARFQKSVQTIHFRSNDENTESVHEHPGSIIVTTNPLTPIDRSKIIRYVKFPRVLRSPESRRIINDIFRGEEGSKGWRNGDGGVYLAGGWCWDGMVLLEGCVVSAMRVASSLGVEIPWAERDQ